MHIYILHMWVGCEFYIFYNDISRYASIENWYISVYYIILYIYVYIYKFYLCTSVAIALEFVHFLNEHINYCCKIKNLINTYMQSNHHMPTQQFVFHSASSPKQQSPERHGSPLRHNILIPSQTVFALSP